MGAHPLGPQPELVQIRSEWGRTLPEAIDHWIARGMVAEHESGCWKWRATLDRAGYGTAYLRKRRCAAHRLFYIHFVSDIPRGLELDHLCRTPACVNPWHLEPVTHSENMRRAVYTHHAMSAKTHCPQGHAYDEANTAHRNGRRHCRACGRIRRQCDKHEMTPENTITRSDGVRWCRTCREAMYLRRSAARRSSVPGVAVAS